MKNQFVKLVENTIAKMNESAFNTYDDSLSYYDLESIFNDYRNLIESEEGKDEIKLLYSAFKKQGLVVTTWDEEKDEPVEAQKPTIGIVRRNIIDILETIENVHVKFTYDVDGQERPQTRNMPAEHTQYTVEQVESFSVELEKNLDGNETNIVKFPKESVIVDKVVETILDKIYEKDKGDDSRDY
jgi:hypothetical protein